MEGAPPLTRGQRICEAVCHQVEITWPLRAARTARKPRSHRAETRAFSPFRPLGWQWGLERIGHRECQEPKGRRPTAIPRSPPRRLLVQLHPHILRWATKSLQDTAHDLCLPMECSVDSGSIHIHATAYTRRSSSNAGSSNEHTDNRGCAPSKHVQQELSLPMP